MQIIKYLALGLVLGLPPALQAQAAAERETLATCRATLDGGSLTTVIEFPDGYRVTAPWAVVAREGGNGNGDGLIMQVTLDRIVERDPDTGEEFTTPFPSVVDAQFQGVDEEELVEQAARMWCLTILKVQQNHTGADADRRSNRAPAAPAHGSRPAVIG